MKQSDDSLVRQDDTLAACLDCSLHVLAQLAECLLQAVLDTRSEGDGEGLAAQGGVLSNGGHLALKQNGAVQQDLLVANIRQTMPQQTAQS